MNYHKIFSFFFVIFVFSSFAFLQKPVSDLERLGLKGKVDELYEIEYIPVQKKNKVVKGKKTYKWQTYHSRYFFYSNGSILSEQQYQADTLWRVFVNINDSRGVKEKTLVMLRGKSKTAEKFYKYDEEGNLIEIHIFHKDKSNPYELYKMKYDKQGNQLEYLYFMDTVQYEKKANTYSEKGWLVESNDYSGENNKDTIPNYTERYLYDDKGNIVEYFMTGEIYFHFINTYNENNQETECKYMDVDGYAYKTTKYVYDSKGNRLSELTMVENEVTEKIEYKYDAVGNWIEKVFYTKDIPQYMLIRTIKYD